MRRLLIVWALFGSLGLWAQPRSTLSGYVRDAANGEALIGVNVLVKETRQGTVSNAYGFYSLSLPEGSYTIEFQYLGYDSQIEKRTLKGKQVLDVTLRETAVNLDEVVVTDRKITEKVTNMEMGVTQLTAKEIAKIPQLLGEVDLIRTLTLMPGVTTVGEGANGFNVRGGNIDQNLILFDNSPVFNSSHLFGFFSIFNGDAVKDVKLYKGGIPSKYGGRLSSVLDIRQKEGNDQRFSGTGGIGVLSTRLLFEGPIVKNKASWLVSGRRSYGDLFLQFSDDPDLNQSQLYFYDLNTKLNWKIDRNNTLFLSGYFGRDVFGVNNLFSFDWGNLAGTLRWNHLWSDRLFSNTTISYSDYNYSLGTPPEDDFSFQWNSTIQNLIFQFDNTWYANVKNTVEYGIQATYMIFEPGTVTGTITRVLQNEYGLEVAPYISNEQEINENLRISYGLRYSTFLNLGGRTVKSYVDNGNPSDETIVDSTTFGRNEVIASFAGWDGLEPRLSINYLLNDNNSVKLGYNRTRQYIHLISNTTASVPTDVWRPAGQFIQPGTANQISLGYFTTFPEAQLEFSVETYYKDLQNLVEYRDGAQLLFKDNIETELLTGRGRAYGLELLLERKSGRLTGFVGYTLSRSERLVEDQTNPLESINNGEWYPANFDKLHDITVVLGYQISKQWSIGTNFAFQTGRPITYPNTRGEFEGIAYPLYNNRNGGRTPAYHRLDISVNYDFKQNPNKRWSHGLVFGAYNVYARRNPYSIFFRPSEANPGLGEAVRLSIFGSIIPFVTYNFKF
jgi:hypothetical protein